MWRDVEQASRNDLPVGDDDHDVRLQRLELFFRFGGTNFRWLKYREACSNSHFFDRRMRDFPSAPTRFVRLREYSSNFEILLSKKMRQGRYGKLRCAAKHDA